MDGSGSPDKYRPDLVGDGWDAEPLMTAAQVADYLQVPTKSVYRLSIPRVRIGKRRIRWRPADVQKFVDQRVEEG